MSTPHAPSLVTSPPTTTSSPEMRAAIESARELLTAWTVAQYLDERRNSHQHKLKSAVCVDPGDSLGEILHTLSRNNILSAPVVEKTSHRYSGFVDVGFILSVFVKGCRRWLSREYGTGMGSETPALPSSGQKETVVRT